MMRALRDRWPGPARLAVAGAFALLTAGACTPPPISYPPPPAVEAAVALERRPIPASGRHVVEPGQSLSEIAWIYRLRTVDLARYNDITDVDRLAVGQRLRLRPPPAPSSPPTAGTDAAPLRVVIGAPTDPEPAAAEPPPVEVDAIDPRSILP